MGSGGFEEVNKPEEDAEELDKEEAVVNEGTCRSGGDNAWILPGKSG